MKIVMLYRPASERARVVDEFVHEFSRRYPQHHIELLNVDTPEGTMTAKTYDITRYPAVLVLRDDGSASMVRQDENLPLIDEVAGYLI